MELRSHLCHSRMPATTSTGESYARLSFFGLSPLLAVRLARARGHRMQARCGRPSRPITRWASIRATSIACMSAMNPSAVLAEQTASSPGRPSPSSPGSWRGFGALTGEGCFRIASTERHVVVHAAGWKSRPGTYGVKTLATPIHIEPWSADPEFATLFPPAAQELSSFGAPADYEVARWESRLIVVEEAGSSERSVPPPMRTSRPYAASRARASASCMRPVTK